MLSEDSTANLNSLSDFKLDEKLIEKEIRRIIDGIGQEFGVKCELTCLSDYPPLYNDPEVTSILKDAKDPTITNVLEYPMLSGSEDF